MQHSSDQDDNERDETSGLLTVTAAGDEGSPRLDRVLAVRTPGLSRSRLKALILDGRVSISQTKANSRPVRDPAYHVAAGDTITIDVPPAVAAEPDEFPVR